MSQFRKKPVVIDAIEWTGDAQAFSRWLSAVDHPRPDPTEQQRYFQFQGSRLAIVTLEGTMMAERGDMVIRGVKGEFYPCKPDIFAATYDPVGPASPVRDPAPPDLDAIVRLAVACGEARVREGYRLAGGGERRYTPLPEENALFDAVEKVRGVRDPSPPEPDQQFGIAVAHALRDAVFCEDGYEGGDALMWEVARRYGLRPAMVEHDEALDCSLTGKHAFAECGSDLKTLEFEAGVRGTGVVPPVEKELRIESSPAYQELLNAERALSDAYLRLRRKLAPFGSFNTPTGPTGPQVWATTEIALDQALRGVVPSAPSRELFDEAMAEWRTKGHSDDWLWAALGLSQLPPTPDIIAWAQSLRSAE